jgi:hypothetical protein
MGLPTSINVFHIVRVMTIGTACVGVPKIEEDLH